MLFIIKHINYGIGFALSPAVIMAVQLKKATMKTTTVSICASVLISALLLASCELNTEDLPENPVPIPITAEQNLLVESSNDFAFDLFGILLEATDKNENIVFSPLSISYSLAMLVNGALGSTRDGILEAMRISSMSLDNINKSYSDLTKALLKVDKRVVIKNANSVWVENSFSPKNPFMKILKDYYDAETFRFSVTDPAAPDAINRWIESKTNGIISKMINDLQPNTVMLLINAIYFKGGWKNSFSKADTRDAPFFVSHDEQVITPMMYRRGKMMSATSDGYIIAELPYGQGNFVMDVILPPEEKSAINELTSSQFHSWIQALGLQETELKMPRFKFGFRQNLRDPLSVMGMETAFSPGEADFHNIADLELYLNDALHQAHIETNEEGTEAAAATIISIGVTSMPQLLKIDLNRPFFFVIREISTKTILFMGRVSDPS